MNIPNPCPTLGAFTGSAGILAGVDLKTLCQRPTAVIRNDFASAAKPRWSIRVVLPLCFLALVLAHIAVGSESVQFHALAPAATDAISGVWNLAPLYSFTNGADGGGPYFGLTVGNDGNLYGTDNADLPHGDGANGSGKIFRVTPDGRFSVVYTFTRTSLDGAGGRYTNNDGSFPNGLSRAGDGSFYSTTSDGGVNAGGTAFRITTNGDLTVLHAFPAWDTNRVNADGFDSFSSLIQTSDGNFYGTTVHGGSNGNGTVFRLASNGEFAVLHSFDATNPAGTNSDGASPEIGLTQASDGNLYGTTLLGGTNGNGTLFRITTNGSFAVLYTFSATNAVGANSDGANSDTTLIQGLDGSLYGAAIAGGSSGNGTLFRITQGGQFTVLHSFSATNFDAISGGFTNADGANVNANLIQASDGNLYGAAIGGGAYGQGTLFQLATNGQFTTLYSFSATNAFGYNPDGAQPWGYLVEAANGNFFGTTLVGGAGGEGTVFELLNPKSAPVITLSPGNQSVIAGGSVTFSAAATGPGPLAYQWQFDGAAIAGATNAALTLSNITTEQSGAYAVVVTNLNGSVVSRAAVLTVNLWGLLPLYSFTNGVDGANIYYGLAQGKDGNLYGTANYGGSNGWGAVFRLSARGQFQPRFSFAAPTLDNSRGIYTNATGGGPNGLLQAADGDFYGTTTRFGANGTGTVFRVTTSGQFTSLYSFSAPDVHGFNTDGAGSYATLIQATDGSLYGTAVWGGTNGNGTVFRITTNAAFSVLHTFAATNAAGTNLDGANPEIGLIQARDGTLYGTTFAGGANGSGTIFRITTNGALTVVHTFGSLSASGANSDGANSDTALVQAADGNLYGVSTLGGSGGNGTVFRVTTNDEFTTLHSFSATGFDPDVGVLTNADGANPNANLIQAADGKLYGAAIAGGLAGNGALFQITTNGQFTTLYSFTMTDASMANVDGSQPWATLLQAGNGDFYGGTFTGGASGHGTLFELINPGAAPVITVEPASQNGSAGAAAAFTVSASGAGPLTYQWLLNGTNLPGATNATLILASLGAGQGGGYSVVVSNPAGGTRSDTARLSFFGLSLASPGSTLSPTLALGDIVGSRYRIDTTTDLSLSSAWTTLTNITLVTTPRSFPDSISPPGPRRFYRAVPLP